MGLFCTNILVVAKLEPVADFLKDSGASGFVVPFGESFVGVFDRRCEDQKPADITDLCVQLSGAFKCVVLGSMVVDDDVFLYWLYEAGRLTDAYNSTPDYASSDWGAPSTGPSGGNVDALCRAFDAADARIAVNAVFELARNADSADFEPDFLIGEDIHAALVKALRLPEAMVGVGYYAIEAGNLPAAFPTRDMRRYGP